MTSTISIKQNKKGTFLDLSKEDLKAEDFSYNFDQFTDEVSGFLSGTAVSLILPEEIDINQIRGDSREIIDTVKSRLNSYNISVKALSSKDLDETVSETGSKQSLLVEEKPEEASEDKEEVDTSTLPETLYVEANLRSGQLIRYPGNVFVLGDVNPSAEIIAAGDIIVWGKLRGIAHAGAGGDEESKIIAMGFETGQLRIASKIATINKDQKKSSPMDLLNNLNGKKNSNIVPKLAKIENNEIIIGNYFGSTN